MWTKLHRPVKVLTGTHGHPHLDSLPFSPHLPEAAAKLAHVPCCHGRDGCRQYRRKVGSNMAGNYPLVTRYCRRLVPGCTGWRSIRTLRFNRRVVQVAGGCAVLVLIMAELILPLPPPTAATLPHRAPVVLAPSPRAVSSAGDQHP